jgi:hypothetical protein
MQLIFVLGCLFTSTFAFAQKVDEQLMIQQLLNNEKDFVIASQIHGLPYGFMQYSTDSSIGLNANGINYIRDDWRNQTRSNLSMVWKPVIVYAASDKLHGITSGPYYIKPPKDSIYHKGGYFLSVWERKTTNDSFRLVSDCGIRINTEAELDEHLVVMNTSAESNKGTQESFTSFQKQAGISVSKAIQQHAINKHELLLGNYGVFIGAGEAMQLNVLEQGATLTIEKQITNTAFHIIAGKITLANNPFPAEKKMQKEGWYFQVWSNDKKQPGLIATLLKF